MKLTTFAPEFAEALPILEQIEAAGFEAYFVGGSVRDNLLGLPIHDVDIATSAYPAEIKQIFKRTVDTGIQHGTVMILDHGNGYEVTTFRTETGYQDFRRPDSVTFVRSLEEDLKRRDFTINALAMRADGEIIDLFDGIADLKAHKIRAVGVADERFHEDALRMMRAVRFESQLGFSVTETTQAAIEKHAALLEKIAIERIHVEFMKLMQGIERQNGLRTFIDTGLYRYCPDLADQLLALERLTALPTEQLHDESAVWLVMTYLLGQTPAQAGRFLKHWKSANDVIDAVKAGLVLLPKLLTATADQWDLYQAGQAVLVISLQIAQLVTTATIPTADWLERYDRLQIKQKADLAINGQILMQNGFQPGPILGKTLAILERKVVLDELLNTTEALLKAAK
ncbi:CCA tRNA nucleotidyltransferase [Latilactobacillus sakei]|uniref:CCA tRNA nucleotidyltransferase n=1 Tax=Latilactobacillus sakei TaxID=1599 RepID=UPI0031339D21